MFATARFLVTPLLSMRFRLNHPVVLMGVLGALLLNTALVIPADSGLSAFAKNSKERARRERSVMTLPSSVQVIGADPASEDVQSIMNLVTDLLKASNSHSLEGVLKHYSPHFTSGDNLSLDEVQKLIAETWKIYPDIKYVSKTMEIRINGDWATVESLDSATASVAPNPAGIINTAGQLESRSRGLLFLRRISKSWEIVSDFTVYENATILYGDARNLKITLSAPDQVFAGESYTAKINLDLAPGTVAIASIVKDPLVYPQLEPQDKFRSLSNHENDLERVFSANITNNNEIVTATVGLTQVSQDKEERPTVRFSGVATVVKRVNVLPVTTYDANNPDGVAVQTSASGSIDLRMKQKKRGGGEEMEIAPGPSSDSEDMDESAPNEEPGGGE